MPFRSATRARSATLRRIYSTKLWHADGRGPIEFFPDVAQWKAYRAFIERWAVLLVADHRMDRIELGASKFEAALAPALFFPLMVVTLILAIFILDGEPWWGRLIVPLVPVTLFCVFLHQTIKRRWPRPMRSLADLDPQLPP